LAENISIPVFVKIRLLNTVPETIALCTQLAEAGAALIAIHARYRVNLVNRSGPGARDGAAFLDQVAVVRQALPSSVMVIANGNIREHADLASNLAETGADGVMSAEGLLDNPAIFSAEFHNKDRLELATEYLDLVQQYPVSMKCLVFHLRRMARDELNKYQMMEECVSCTTPEAARAVIDQCKAYRDKGNYEFDPMKEIKAKKELARRKEEEGKRKRYEERMNRKAKREGKDPSFYLMQGAEVPTIERLKLLRAMPKEKAFAEWKASHSQHCYDFHFNENKCKRDRTCAFLHADPAFVSNEAEKYG
jgi:tRNA-dihydrouridine synthase